VALNQQPSEVGEQFAGLFHRTPYENAPIEVQQQTLKNAQIRLARSRLYDGPVDGLPGPATERAIVLYQGSVGLTQTGRLDLDTLAQMRLLPNSGRPVLQPFYANPQSQRVYRGVWMQ
jgi:peptidoglycan hydrolase-like protein with peptidoglycan-binding domain